MVQMLVEEGKADLTIKSKYYDDDTPKIIHQFNPLELALYCNNFPIVNLIAEKMQIEVKQLKENGNNNNTPTDKNATPFSVILNIKTVTHNT